MAAETFTQADLDAARAAGREGAFAEVQAIAALSEAKGREAQALAMALNGIPLETARSVLSVSPKASSLAMRVAAEGGAGLGAFTPDAPDHGASRSWDKAIAEQNARHLAHLPPQP